MSFHLFGAALGFICFAISLYCAWRLRRWLGAGRRLYWLFAALALSFPAAREFGGAAGVRLALAWLGYGWLGSVLILFTVLLAADLGMAAARAAGLKVNARLCGYTALGAAMSFIVHAFAAGLAAPAAVAVDAPLAGLPSGLDGFRIAQVSDFHLGRFTGAGRLGELVRQLNELNPDLVVFTGDFMERREPPPPEACGLLKAVKARRGVVAVLGNHDLFGAESRTAELFSACGVKVLRDEVYEPAPGLEVGGVDDLKRSPLAAAAADALAARLLRPGKAALLLSHQPQGWEAVMRGAPGLVLSGHTHAGQIFPFNLLERPVYKYFYGLYRDRATLVYVASGAGTWGPPMRLFTRSELPVITLRAAR